MVPLRPIWTIMVAAKLDQSRVLVTKFRENRLMLKGRSAGQRQTDRLTHRHTYRQTHRQTQLKIMALKVCNRANSNCYVYCAITMPCLDRKYERRGKASSFSLPSFPPLLPP